MTKSERAALKAYKEFVQEHEAKCKALAAKQQEAEEADAQRIADEICLIGETAPCLNATTEADARKVANDWLQLLHLPIVDGEALLDAERRVYYEWNRQGCPGFNIQTRELVLDYFAVPQTPKKFEDVWTPMES